MARAEVVAYLVRSESDSLNLAAAVLALRNAVPEVGAVARNARVGDADCAAVKVFAREHVNEVVVGQERTRGTFLVDGEKTVASNNCLIVYTRQVDGRWLMHRDIWNTISDAAGSGSY